MHLRLDAFRTDSEVINLSICVARFQKQQDANTKDCRNTRIVDVPQLDLAVVRPSSPARSLRKEHQSALAPTIGA